MRTLILTAALMMSPLALPLVMTGCESTSSVGSLANLNPSELMSGYTSKLGDLGGLLSGVKDSQSAATALPKAKDLVNSLGSYAEQLNALPAGQVDSLMTQYGAQLDPAMAKVDEQIARLANQPTYGSALSSALKSIPKLGA